MNVEKLPCSIHYEDVIVKFFQYKQCVGNIHTHIATAPKIFPQMQWWAKRSMSGGVATAT